MALHFFIIFYILLLLVAYFNSWLVTLSKNTQAPTTTGLSTHEVILKEIQAENYLEQSIVSQKIIRKTSREEYQKKSREESLNKF